MNRRGFLKFAAGGTVGLVASPIIWNTLYDAVYWSQNWGWIPRVPRGDSTYMRTISKLCPSGTGIRVRLVDGQPVRALSDPDNPLSRGALTALAAAETQLMVSPARLKEPLRRTPDGALVAISWEDAEKLLREKLAEAGGSTACISGDPTSTVNELLSSLVESRGSADFYFMPDDEQAALAAWSAMGGMGRLGYDVDNSDFILAIGANMLESWGTVARNRRNFSAGRPAGQEARVKFAYAGPVQNNTAAGADWWLPCRDGMEMELALGIAHLLIKAGHAVPSAGLDDFKALAGEYTPEKVAALTGVDAGRLAEVAKALAGAEKPLVLVGSALGAGGGAGAVMAGIAVNMLLGRVGAEGGLVNLPFPTPVVTGASDYRTVVNRNLIAWSQSVASGETEAPRVLLIYDANPLYSLPSDSGMEEVFTRSGFKVAMASFLSESCARCDLVLPAAMGLERFDDCYTPYGSGEVSWCISHPLVKPFYNSRPMGEVLISLAKELGVETGVKDMPGLLYKKAYSLGANFRKMVESGAVFQKKASGAFSVPVYNTDAIRTALTLKKEAAPLSLAPVVVLGMGTAQTGIPPFATKIITEYQLAGHSSVAQMNAATADKLGVRKGARVTVGNGKVKVPALVDIFEGVLPDAVALSAGLGHTAFDEFSRNKGSNIMTLTSITREPGTGLPVWSSAGVSVDKA